MREGLKCSLEDLGPSTDGPTSGEVQCQGLERSILIIVSVEFVEEDIGVVVEISYGGEFILLQIGVGPLPLLSKSIRSVGEWSTPCLDLVGSAEILIVATNLCVLARCKVMLEEVDSM